MTDSVHSSVLQSESWELPSLTRIIRQSAEEAADHAISLMELSSRTVTTIAADPAHPGQAQAGALGGAGGTVTDQAAGGRSFAQSSEKTFEEFGMHLSALFSSSYVILILSTYFALCAVTVIFLWLKRRGYGDPNPVFTGSDEDKRAMEESLEDDHVIGRMRQRRGSQSLDATSPGAGEGSNSSTAPLLLSPPGAARQRGPNDEMVSVQIPFRRSKMGVVMFYLWKLMMAILFAGVVSAILINLEHLVPDEAIKSVSYRMLSKDVMDKHDKMYQRIQIGLLFLLNWFLTELKTSH